MKIHFIACFTVLPLLMLIQGCNSRASVSVDKQINQKTFAPDSWYNAGPPGIEPWSWNKLAVSEVFEVANTAETKSEHMLRQKPVIKLSMKQAKALVGRQLTLTKSQGKMPYLVRTVYFNKETGQFEIYTKEKKLWVDHGSLGRSPVPMKRQALVVLLKVRPNQVFVTCSMAA